MWLATRSVEMMLDHLSDLAIGRQRRPWEWLMDYGHPGLNWVRDRRLRLYACACVRRLGELVRPPACLQAVEASEAFADGRASGADLEEEVARAAAALAACYPDEMAMPDGGEASPYPSAAMLAMLVRQGARPGAAAWAAVWAARSPREAPLAACVASAESAGLPTEVLRHVCFPLPHADLIREVFGNPYHPVAADPAWLAWKGGAVRQLAEAAYQERQLPAGTLDRTRLAVLADALSEAMEASGSPPDEPCTACRGLPEKWRCRRCHGMFGRDECASRGEPLACPTCLCQSRLGLLEPWRPKCALCGNSGRVSPALLAHLRSPGPHVRGCWALDLLTGRRTDVCQRPPFDGMVTDKEVHERRSTKAGLLARLRRLLGW
jgi:hypothetical protein